MDVAHPVRTAALLVVMFCAFFWLGFFAGKNSAHQAAAVPLESPRSERLHFQLAGE